ncbi:MAG: gamma-glutamyltransferase family protein [Gammaproteobacteria bacterium]|nr:gamma-glutamyltransferase family protein [Gammaproteobacteria bacterium]
MTTPIAYSEFRESAVLGSRYMVSAGHYLAAQAAFAILEAGGNAIDAGVAANLALGVLQSDQVNIAGVAPIMIYLARERRVLTISGLGPWPRAASIEKVAGAPGADMPLGILRTVVPAAPDANIRALSSYGTMSFADIASSAIRFAADGFPMHRLMSTYVAKHEESYRRWPANRAIYLPDGHAPRPGELFRQTDLAALLRHMADEERAAAGRGREASLEAARGAFYRGDIAAAILDYHHDNGGLLRAEDLAGYASAIEEPARRTFEGFGRALDVYTCGPWCQGPALLMMLAILEGIDLARLGHNSVDYVHVVAEAMKLALADRERYFGDPRFVDVPLERLTSPAYAAGRRASIHPERAWPGMPPAGDGTAASPAAIARTEDVPLPGDTSYVCVVDAEGNVFSCNPSDVTWESPVIPGTGICPSSRGSQSWTVPGHPSVLAPGKRPRLTPNPVLVMRDGELVMPLGTPGGDTQTQAVLQVLLNHQLFGMDAQEAVEAPRFVTHSHPDSFAPHTAYPGRLTVESRIGETVGATLAARGHDVEWLEPVSWKTGGVCLIARDPRSGALRGGADPRRPSAAIGW